MRIKEISVLVRKSYSYQSFECGEIIQVGETETKEEIEEERRKAQARCRKAVMEQIALEKGSSL